MVCKDILQTVGQRWDKVWKAIKWTPTIKWDWTCSLFDYAIKFFNIGDNLEVFRVNKTFQNGKTTLTLMSSKADSNNRPEPLSHWQITSFSLCLSVSWESANLQIFERHCAWDCVESPASGKDQGQGQWLCKSPVVQVKYQTYLGSMLLYKGSLNARVLALQVSNECVHSSASRCQPQSANKKE